ncbi:MAG: hypothetical protein M0024_08390 [Nitrospiraceae bacterium]|nr:hypothetical protein [Nitrospiraceae bacterium]
MIKIDALYLLLLGEAFVLIAVLALILYLRLRRAKAANKRLQQQREKKAELDPTETIRRQKLVSGLETEIERLKGVVRAKESEIAELVQKQPASAVDSALQEELMSINLDMPKGEDLSEKVRELEAIIQSKDKEIAAAQKRFDDLEREYLALYNEKMASQ